MNLTNQSKGSQRDKAIIEALRFCRALDTDQIALLFFRDIKSGRRRCQRRLWRLYGEGLVKRTRVSSESYVYYLDKRPTQLEHLLSVNWVYCTTVAGLNSWEKLTEWVYTPSGYRVVIPDAFYGIYNRFTKEYNYVFVEVDLNHNAWDKVEKYNAMYELEIYLEHEWSRHAQKFPQVLVVTTDDKRREELQDYERKFNAGGLVFTYKLLENHVVRRRRTCSQKSLGKSSLVQASC